MTTMTMPIYRAAPPAPGGASRGDDPGRSGSDDVELAKPAILVVDDVHANLVSLEAVLEPLGHRIVRATSGSEALKRLLVEEFAVVLLDVQMPDIDGFETAAMIKTHPRLGSTPIIFITAISRENEHVFHGYEQGAVDYLLKPVDPAILRAKVSVFVDLFLRGERIKAQSALLQKRERELGERRMRERYLHAMETMPVLLWSADTDGIVRYANTAWREYSGIPAPKLIAFDDRRVLHSDDRREVLAAWSEAVRSRTGFDAECRLRRADGSFRWHAVRARLERDSNDGWIVTATDVDESRRADETRAELLRREQIARQQAEAASRSKDEFLATVSHELRTPLHAITGWIKMLRAGSLDPATVEKALETIERNATLQAELVNDLLDVSGIAQGKFEIQARTTVLADVSRAATVDLQPFAEARGVSIGLELGDGSDRAIAGDPVRLQQVVWNLISNAVKFSPSSGQVLVRVRVDEDEAEVAVEDEGEGMPESFLPFAFEPFTQADGGSTRKQGGLGLGLSIVRHVVELHGGRVLVERTTAGKTSFRVRLPLTAPPSETSPEPVREVNPVASSGIADLAILVVDDDQDSRELMSTLLEAAGATVRTAASTREAIAALDEAPADVLVSDIGLPEEDGCALIRRIREAESDGRRIPAVAVSGFARSGDRERALGEGFDRHFGKPLDFTRFLAELSELVSRGPG